MCSILYSMATAGAKQSWSTKENKKICCVERRNSVMLGSSGPICNRNETWKLFLVLRSYTDTATLTQFAQLGLVNEHRFRGRSFLLPRLLVGHSHTHVVQPTPYVHETTTFCWPCRSIQSSMGAVAYLATLLYPVELEEHKTRCSSDLGDIRRRGRTGMNRGSKL